jgi:predicted phosphodiesterase
VRTVTVECSEISTTPGLKVAFIGDSDHYDGYRSVLELVKREGTQGVVFEGDMSYSADPDAWWAATEAVLGEDFPVFISRGNHDDSSWSGFLPKAEKHLGGAERIAGAHDANYKTIWHGLVIATIRKGDTAENITPLLQDEPHIWKICQWHQNQKKMQIGGKSDEMGWGVYEACRKLGAIVETGHEHSYERTRTLIDTSTQTVDSTCGSATELCVGPGRTFVNVVGLGGNSVRVQALCLPATFPYGCNGEWASIYTSNQNATFGAQFITFNAGSPKKARGYFKDVAGKIVDEFTVNYDAAH